MSTHVDPPLAHRRKRAKVSPDNSSETSISSKSDSTVKASNAIGQSTDASDLNSDDESSELSESSEEPSDLSSSEDEDAESTKMDTETPKEPEVVNLRANRGTKPTYRLDEEELGPDIRTFLKDFLPQLKAANEELEAQRKEGTLKKRVIESVDADEDQQYIEMVRFFAWSRQQVLTMIQNLGLGVLKMKDEDNSESSSNSDSDMSDDGDATKEEDVLSKLMGQEKTKEVAGIQEVHEKQDL